MSANIPNDRMAAHMRHPSLTAISETSRASSDVSSLHHPFPSFPDYGSSSLDQVTVLPVSSSTSRRNTRKLTIDSATSLPSSAQPIRRKPLSLTASPIATRYSSGEYMSHAKDLPRPEQRYDRAWSVDSPTVYEFPPQAHAEPVPLVGDSSTKPHTPSDTIKTQANKG